MSKHTPPPCRGTEGEAVNDLTLPPGVAKSSTVRREEHSLLVAEKIGHETGIKLYRATCTCGWEAPAWYSSEEYLERSFSYHSLYPGERRVQ